MEGIFYCVSNIKVYTLQRSSLWRSWDPFL